MPEASQIIMLGLSTIIGSLSGAFGAYVAIRSDLAALKAVIEIHSSSINRAHERIDSQQNRN